MSDDHDQRPANAAPPPAPQVVVPEAAVLRLGPQRDADGGLPPTRATDEAAG